MEEPASWKRGDDETCLSYSEDDLEEYVLGRVSGTALETLEEHLLLCQSCQARVSQIDAFLKDFRAAVTLFESGAGADEESASPTDATTDSQVELKPASRTASAGG